MDSELIEKAADEIWRRVTRVGTAGNETYEFCKGTAEAVLAVFEQAHTPTAHSAHSGHEYGGGYARAAALAAGDPDWMNATGGTPSDDEREALFDIINRAMIEAWTDADEYAYAPAYIRDAILAAGFRRTVQGEPTNARVKAALIAYWGSDQNARFYGSMEGMRAALRATAEAEEPEGEVEYRVFDREGELWASTNSLDEARHYLAQEPDGFARIERAVWVPVEQEDE